MHRKCQMILCLNCVQEESSIDEIIKVIDKLCMFDLCRYFLWFLGVLVRK